MAYLASLYLFGYALALIPREVINCSPVIPNLIYSEDVIIILSRLSNFNEMLKVKCLSLPLISLYFLTLQQTQILIVTALNSPILSFYPHKIFRVEQLR